MRGQRGEVGFGVASTGTWCALEFCAAGDDEFCQECVEGAAFGVEEAVESRVGECHRGESEGFLGEGGTDDGIGSWCVFEVVESVCDADEEGAGGPGCGAFCEIATGHSGGTAYFFDELCDAGSEPREDFLDAGGGVFDDVVEDGGCEDLGLVDAGCGEAFCHADGMGDERCVAVASGLAFVSLGGEGFRGLEEQVHDPPFDARLHGGIGTSVVGRRGTARPGRCSRGDWPLWCVAGMFGLGFGFWGRMGWGGRSMSAKSNLVGVVLSVFALFLAGCSAPAPSPTTGDDAVTLQYFPHPGLGNILADPRGRVVYVFTNDEPGKSNCYDQCAANWPPYLLDEEPNGPSDVVDEFGLVTRTDGKTQLSYRDRPLYFWAKDVKGGDATGDGVGGIWFVVRQPPASDEHLNGRGGSEVDAQNVTYHASTTGYFAEPRGKDSPTGVVMVHEWWGLNDNMRGMAEILASHGYAVLAVDLFEGKVASTSQEAQAQVAGLDQGQATANMQAAADYLRAQGVEEVAVLGWCFGGGQALQLSMSGEELVATVIYYGFLETDQAKLEPIKWPVLGIFGESDQAISVPTVRAFEQALGNLTIENEIYIYPDVGHAFANPSGGGWAPEETKDAWERTLTFLAYHTKAVE